MDGEKQLQMLEQKAKDAELKGGAFAQKDKDKLARAKDIQKRGQIFNEEHKDPILEAAYQRYEERISLEKYSTKEDGDISEDTPYNENLEPEESITEDSISEELLEEDLVEENILEEELEIEQETNVINGKIEHLYQEGHSFKKPSKLKYLILFIIALIVDVIDLAGFTGIAYALTIPISLICSVLIILIFWFTNTRQKRAEDFQKGIEQYIKDLQTNIAHLERRTVQIARLTNKLTRNRAIKRLKPVRALRKGAAYTLKFVRRSPITKYIGAAIANLIPILGFLPWQIIGVWLSYRDERESYKDAAKAADNLAEEAPA